MFEYLVPPSPTPLSNAEIGRTYRLDSDEAKASASWLVNSENQRFWRLAIKSPRARALRLSLSKFEVGAGSLWIYGAQADPREGIQYTGKGPHNDGEFWSPTVMGDTAILEFMPEDPGSPAPSFSLKEIARIERWPFDTRLQPTVSMAVGERALAGCHLDATCYLDRDNMREVITAGVQYFFIRDGRAGFCSGTMLNASGLSGEAFMITASHCVATDQHARSLEIFTDHETTSCNGPVRDIMNRRGQAIPGRVVAQVDPSQADIALIRLDRMPSGQRSLAPWSENLLANGTRLAVIGHPDSKYRRIAFGPKTDTPFTSFTGLSTGLIVAEGAVEEGSSGGGVFARMAAGTWALVGVVSGGNAGGSGPAHCSGRAEVKYGRFDTFYPAVRTALTPPVVPPVINSFTASASSIQAGERSLLKWSITGTLLAVSISDVRSLGPAPVGEVTVAPDITTTYVLTASNSGGTAQARVTVTVIGAPSSLAAMTSPAAGSSLAGACATFRWSAGNRAVEYFLEVGLAEGSTQYAAFSAGLDLSREICGLPTNGSAVFVRLWTKFLPEDWRYNDY